MAFRVAGRGMFNYTVTIVKTYFSFLDEKIPFRSSSEDFKFPKTI